MFAPHGGNDRRLNSRLALIRVHPWLKKKLCGALRSRRLCVKEFEADVFSTAAGLFSEFVFQAWVCEVVMPVTNRAKGSSNPLVVIQVTATQGRQRIRNSA